MPSTRSTTRESGDSSDPSRQISSDSGGFSHLEETDDDVDDEPTSEESDALEYYEPGDDDGDDEDEDETETETEFYGPLELHFPLRN